MDKIDNDWRNFIIMVCVLATLLCFAFCFDKSLEAYSTNQAMKQGYIQQKCDSKILWVKPETKVEQTIK